MATSMAGIRSLFWYGFTRYASAPASRASSITSRWLNAVSISTPQIRSAVMIRAASRPSMPGILMSRIARSGRRSRTSVDGLVAATGLAHDVVALLFQGLTQVEADDCFVLGDHNTDRHWRHPF